MNTAYEKHVLNVEKHRSLILEAERHIWKNPETGFREWKTTA
jgi:metal-dependent amidase/aminoacylase/carboxypeptidase family protein